MSIITRATGFILCMLIAGGARAADKAFDQVQKKVHARTRKEVHWERDLQAREDARTRVRALLKKPLSLGAAVQVALLNNRNLQAAFEEIGLSYADLREARLLPNPEIDLSVKFPDRAPRNPLTEWNFAQNFIGLLMIPLKTRVAQQKLAAAQARAADKVVELVAETKSAYWELVATMQTAAKLQVILESQRAALDLAQRLHEAGNITDLRLSQDHAEYSQLRLEVATNESSVREQREKLNRLLGLWGANTEWKLATSELPDVPASDLTIRGLETLAVQNRLDLTAARSDLLSAARALGLERTFRFIGGLDFGISGEHEPEGTNLIGPSLRFELPIFNQGQAKLARGEAQLRMSAAKFEQLAIVIRSTVRELRDRLLSAAEIARFHKEEVVPTRHRITALTLLQYNAMLVGAFEAFTARREDLQAEKDLIAATRDYWTIRAELERAVGGDLEAASARVTQRSNAADSKAAKPLKSTHHHD
jgi:outer membrane protein, heavy metal efflux system